ncbi:hypothetical protein [Erythrobacter rubeus]|uniref:DUF11 domain-containing protein n=1 Tax=Erythrobacter rubeus TaxID=2760803 RepID=A0ABR8KS44_9SPHN|nr:hypothetical protein [Erythrobacter rubeus]MBD2841893.1 hypothetical protein [Erythrobacter rubeus]
MNTFAKFAAALCATSLFAAPAFAQDAGPGETLGATTPVELSGDVLLAKTVSDASGVERIELVEPDLIVPGDRLVFGTMYKNSSAEAVTNFTVTNPLPEAVRLAPDADAELVVSVDGAKTWGILANLTIVSANGAERSAIHADVTHVRWTLDAIAPGESGRLEYQAIIR